MNPTPLRLDSACCRQLNWRTDLPPAARRGAIEACLAEEGWTARSRHPVLRVWRHPRGHELAWVRSTGRVQLRVDLGVPEEDRPTKAQDLYDTLIRCWRRGGQVEHATDLGTDASI